MTTEPLSNLQLVEEFHNTFNHPINKDNSLETLKTRQLRIKLLFEELSELAQASDCGGTFQQLCQSNAHDEFIAEDGDNVNRVEELDALCDIEYVLCGKIITSGHQSHFQEAFNDVHDSNMSKAYKSIKEVQEDFIELQKAYGKPEHDFNINYSNKKHIIVRNDGKILKSLRYTPVNLSKYIK